MKTTKKVRLTLEIEVSAPPAEDHERAVWTAAIAVTPTLQGVAFGPAKTVGVEAEDELLAEAGRVDVQRPEQQATERKTAAAAPIHGDVRDPVAEKGRETAQGRTVGLTLPIVRHFGIAFGLWGYSTDVALTGRGQGNNPDLIAVEETDVYAAVVEAIEAQEPTRRIKREIAGRNVWSEEGVSELYGVLREAMFEAYRWAPCLPPVNRYGADRLAPPSHADPSWTFSANPILDNPDLLQDLSSASLAEVLVREGVVRVDQVLPHAGLAGEVRFSFASEGEALAFIKRFNRWLLDHAVAVAKGRWAAAETARP
jgi:hypothetical protein